MEISKIDDSGPGIISRRFLVLQDSDSKILLNKINLQCMNKIAGTDLN